MSPKQLTIKIVIGVLLGSFTRSIFSAAATIPLHFQEKLDERLLQDVCKMQLSRDDRIKNLNEIRGLLKAKADPNVTNSRGITPLFLAIGNNNLPIVKQLILFNADPGKRSLLGFTALELARGNGERQADRVSVLSKECSHALPSEERSVAHAVTELTKALSERKKGMDLIAYFEHMQPGPVARPPTPIQEWNCLFGCNP